jgi:hypothetical protein
MVEIISPCRYKKIKSKHVGYSENCVCIAEITTPGKFRGRFHEPETHTLDVPHVKST